ncbi:MAG TPA: hypothetical protein VFD90_09280 [Gaiellales bacterium]|nr:hypothetical protein [Gaiellales bacterium]
MPRRPFLLAIALLASLAFAQAAAAQPITLQVTSARTTTNQPDPVELTGTITLAPNTSGSGTSVTGTGTLFTSELHAGDLIKPYTAPGSVPRWLVVSSITSNTALRITQPGAGGGRYNGPAVTGAKFSTLPPLQTITKGDPVTTYKYLVNQEDTDQNSQSAAACQPSGPNSTLSGCLWTSIRHLSGSSTAAPGPWNPTNGFQSLVPDSSPVVTSGDQSDFANGGTIDLPAGKYLISFVAEGHKIDGAHFTTDGNGTLKTIQAQAQPFDLPLATLRIQVFNDNASTNGQWDEGDESYDAQANRAARMPGFTAHLADVLGEITTDWYGNPLCTTYRTTTAPGRTGYELDSQGRPIILTRGGQCVSNMAGEIAVPNMGPDRYATTVLAPARRVVTPPGLQPTCLNKDWVKTTTLEGGPDWDTWIQEGATGYDTEFLHSGEPTPWTMAGFVCPKTLPVHNASTVGTVKGRVLKARVYWPAQGGLPYNGTIWGGYAGTKTDGPIDRPWVSLAGLQQGDVAVAIQRGNPDGTFEIDNVPPGDYMVSIWDQPLNNLLDTYNLTVRAAKTTDIGDAMLSGWFSQIKGTVFNDLNENGRQDAGEVGIAGFPVVIKSRVNSIMDQGSAVALTDFAGHYTLDQAYPLNLFNVLEAFDTRWKTTGLTYQADNQPTPTTELGGGVDLSFLPVIGLSGRVDWGVKPYSAGENGGIVGTVTYDTTRNELDPSQSATEDYQPGIPGLQVDLFKPVACTGATPAASCSSEGYVLADDGSYTLGDWIQRYQTESWQQPKNCTARGVDGTPLVGEQVLPRTTDPIGNPINCLEGPLMGVQFGGDDPLNSPNPDANFFSSVDGNYGFGDGWTTPGGRLPDGSPDPASPGSGSQPLAVGDYLVKVELPSDPLHADRKLYTPTREEDVNVFSGDSFKPSYPPPPCAGALHTVHVTNPDFLDAGGSPYEGQAKPLCDTKLVAVQDAKSVAPSFNLFTDVPVPTKFWGLINDDLNISVDPKSILFGEKAGVGHAPVGIYDFTDRLVDTQHSDANGFFTSLLPSTSTYNCPLPAGPCPNMYRVVGNDPGLPGARNADYHSEFSTISAPFQAWPGLILPVDTAPTQVGASIQSPGSNVVKPVECVIAGTTPQLFAVSTPYGNPGDQIVVHGLHFGATEGQVQIDGTTTISAADVTNWSDTSFTLALPASPGQHRIAIVNTAAAPNAQSVNGLNVHVLGNGYRPDVIEVGPDMWTLLGAPTSLRFRLGTNGTQTAQLNAPFSAAQIQGAISGLPGLAGAVQVQRTAGGNYRITITGRHSAEVLTATANGSGASIRNFDSRNPNPDYGMHAVQAGLDAAAARPNATFPGPVGQRGPEALVVVYPNSDSSELYNAESAYYENLIMHSPAKLQGVGPGGILADGSDVPGTVVDGSGYQADAQSGTDWTALMGSLAFGGNANIYDGSTVTVVANDGGSGTGTTRVAQFRTNFPASIDGLKITGGNHDGFPNNPNIPNTEGGPVEAATTQGGGIYVNAQAHSLQITNDVIQGNSGAYGGAIRLGTPEVGYNANDNIRIGYNRIDKNGGTNLAGGIGIFAGATNYRIDHNTLCANTSAEYGGAISHFGLSNGGSIDHNRIWFNRSYDEGGAVFIGGELPANPNTMTQGAGTVSIRENVMQANLSNDDGGAIRLLMVDGKRRSQTGQSNIGTLQLFDDRINILNNTIANNISTHEGGGIALDDATNVAVANNTIAHNTTTATAITSNGQPAPAGLSTAANSILLQAELDKRYGVNSRALFSKPTLFNNLFTDNRAGSWSAATGLSGIGLTGDPGPARLWDIGLADGLCTGGNTRRCLTPVRNRLDTSALNAANVTTLADNLVGTPVNFIDDTYRVAINALPWRGYPQFVGAVLIAADLAVGQMGNYHLDTGSSAINAGAASTASVGGIASTVPAPTIDIDDQGRANSSANPNDIGSDERQ